LANNIVLVTSLTFVPTSIRLISELGLGLGFFVVDLEYVFVRAFFDGEGGAAAADSVSLGRDRLDL
jgi:hypothetical protein